MPLVFVAGIRALRGDGDAAGSGTRRWSWRERLLGHDAALALAGAAGVLLAQVAQRAVHPFGGFRTHAVPAGLVGAARLGHSVWIPIVGLSVAFGVYPPDMHNPAAVAAGVVHAVLLLAVVVAAADRKSVV